jgi:hypothetical protein
MLKLYRTTASGTEYWEAWNTTTKITVHWGKLGDQRESRELPLEPGVLPSGVIRREAKPIRAAGFKPLKRTELRSLVIQYKVDERGSTDDFDKRVEVENLMNECLGWTGLGHCDGGDMGSGEMSIFCFVVDASVAEGVIVRELKSHGFLDGAVIAQRTEDEYQVLWPHDFKGQFSVI